MVHHRYTSSNSHSSHCNWNPLVCESTSLLINHHRLAFLFAVPWPTEVKLIHGIDLVRIHRVHETLKHDALFLISTQFKVKSDLLSEWQVVVSVELVARNEVHTAGWSLCRKFDLEVLILFDGLVQADLCWPKVSTHLHKLHCERNLGTTNVSEAPDFFDGFSWLKCRVFGQVLIDE